MKTRRLVTKGRIAALAVLLVLALGLGWLVLFSSVLGLRTIEVEGTSSLTVQEVTDLLDIPTGTPLARVDLAAAETALEGVSQVDAATISRGWPGTLLVQLDDRIPVAAVDRGGTLWLVDADGVLFAQVSAAPEGVVLLQVPDAGPEDPATRAGLTVLAALDPTIAEALTEIRAPTSRAVELALLDDRVVLWGGPEDSELKSEVLAALLTSGVPGSVFDVRSPEAAVVS